jgi:hypothetical protein
MCDAEANLAQTGNLKTVRLANGVIASVTMHNKFQVLP